VSRPTYRRPKSVAEAVSALAAADGDAYVLGGGTVFMLLRQQGLIDPALVVDLEQVDELRGIRLTPGGAISIGAMATIREIETDELVREHVPALAIALSHVATVRIRNQATLGGNLAHADPAQDPPTILMALDAEVEIAGPAGVRREPLDGFFTGVFETSLGASEIITRIVVPAPRSFARVGYEKFLPRTTDDYATVAVAVRLDVEDGVIGEARIVLGAAAATPLRVLAAEALVCGAPVGDVSLDGVAAAATVAADPADDARGSAAYKREMAGVFTRRLVRRLLVAA
jgi:carbon-monoxide dehydrogenase medium subunit